MSRERYKAAVQLEKKAEKLCSSVLRRVDVHGFLCWYCDATLIEKGAEQVFVGIHPAGGPCDKAKDLREGTREKLYTIPGWNIWLDGEKHHHQKAVCRLFKKIHDSGWKRTLRSTACFNVFPFRTSKWAPPLRESGLWDPLAKWLESVLVQIKPKCIICNGNDENLGPWAAIKKQFEWDCLFDPVPLWSTYTLKGLEIKRGPLAGTKVLRGSQSWPGWSISPKPYQGDPEASEGGALGLRLIVGVWVWRLLCGASDY